MVLALSQQAATERRAPDVHSFRSLFELHTPHPLAAMLEAAMSRPMHPQLDRVPTEACYWEHPAWVEGLRRAIASARLDEMARAVERVARVQRAPFDLARAERGFVVANAILAEDEATAELACARACEAGDVWLFAWGLADMEWLARAPERAE